MTADTRRSAGKTTTVVDPVGLAGRMFWQTELTGGNVGGCCIALSLADYGRLGQFVLEGGKGTVPQGWFAEAGRAHVDLGWALHLRSDLPDSLTTGSTLLIFIPELRPGVRHF
jgi:hypothetical protein